MLTADVAGKRVLVTGAGGFIGSHLAEELARRGASVRAFVRYKSRAMRGWLENGDGELLRNIEFFPGDITDSQRVREAMRGVEIVWHLAALIGIPYSYHAPASYVDVNVKGTLNLLEAAREQGVGRFVHTSTSEVYGTPENVPISEGAPLRGQSPYSATKIAADKLAESYYCSFQLPVVIARPFNAFGPRQSARAVVPAIISQVIGGGRALKLGALETTRDLNYVSNTVDGMIAAAFAPDGALGEAINIGSGRDISIGDLARMIMRMAGHEIPIETEASRLRPVKSEVERLVADDSRAREWMQWQPKVSLEEGLERTIAWMREHADEYRAEEYVV